MSGKPSVRPSRGRASNLNSRAAPSFSRSDSERLALVPQYSPTSSISLWNPSREEVLCCLKHAFMKLQVIRRDSVSAVLSISYALAAKP